MGERGILTMAQMKDKNITADQAALDTPVEEKIPTNFTESIYYAITKAFASGNPKQLFCLSWPGTVLDHERLAWDPDDEVAGIMPETQFVRSSQILDQYVPPSPITQPDGTRVSDRYANAISALGPRPNTELIKLQSVIRERLRTEITKTIDGKEQTVTLVSWFNYLYTQWSQEKEQWSRKQTEIQTELRAKYPDDDEKYWNSYLSWYEENADAYIQDINSKWDQLLIEFPLTEWQDALAILDTHDDGGLNAAKDLMQNVRLPLPRQEGIDYVPTSAIPYDWPQELRPTTKHIDLLADPIAQKMALDTAITKLEDEVLNWMAILPKVDSETVAASTKTFNEAIHSFSRAQTELLTQYSANVLTAVQIYCDIQKSRGLQLHEVNDGESQSKLVSGVQKLVDSLAASSTGGGAGPTVNWDQIKEVAEKLHKGQESLIGKQQGLIDAGLNLADAANDYLEHQAKSTLLTWLPTYVEQLKSKLKDLQEQQANLAAAANVYYKYLTAKPKDPEESPEETFGQNAFATKLEHPASDRWTEVNIAIDASEMSSDSRMNTYFQAHQWGVDFFIGSAGGSSRHSYSHFANTFMKKGTKIQVGFLATKVLIQRPWMKPEIFNNSASYFRTLEKPLSPATQVTQNTVLNPANQNLVAELAQNYTLPAYPVAVLLVKDVTIKVQIDSTKTEDVRTLAKSIRSQGGGFLCFSVSSVETSQSQSEKMNSFCMAGQMIAKATAPQIIGHWVEFTSPDKSVKIDQATATQIAEAIGFVNKLQTVHHAMKERKEVPLR